MTATLERPAAPIVESRTEPSSGAARPVPPLAPRRALLRGVFVSFALLVLFFLLHLLLLGRLQHSAAQAQLFDDFRDAVAQGTAPVGPTDFDGVAFETGTPVARLQIPRIGLDQIVVEGTTAEVLVDGPGHRRDTPLPGQAGVSRVFGKRTSAGAAFGRLGELTAGDAITVTTAQGVFEFRVVGSRTQGDPISPLASVDAARLTLVTAGGPWYAPDGVFRVDADLVGDAVGGPSRLVTAAELAPAELPNGTDDTELWILAFSLQLLLVLSVGAVWAWHRWGRPHAWISFVPPLLFVASLSATQATRLLPNLL
ncbi:MAG: sortase [Actinomycetota bacterium]